MNEIQTPKGKKLPILKLKGKDYLQVPWRVVWFREEYPLGRIDTQLVESTTDHVVYSATISIPDEKNGNYIKLADASKKQTFKGFADAHEKAQTGAIGRALALCGYGTAFAPDMEEDDAGIVDAPTEPKETPPVDNSAVLTKTQELKKEEIGNLAKKLGWKDQDYKGNFKKITGKEHSGLWTDKDYDKVIVHLSTLMLKNPQLDAARWADEPLPF